MKKILSLVLAVLMLASLAVSTSAVNILNSDRTGFIKTDKDDKATIADLIDIYSMLGLDAPYGGPIHYFGDTLYTWWYDDCPECHGFCFCYVKSGVVNYKCLEPNCGKTGTIGSGSSSGSGTTDKNESTDSTNYSGVACTNCGKKRTVFIETVIAARSALANRYYCSDCREFFYTSADVIEEDDYDHDESYRCSQCYRWADFDFFYVSDGKLYARYECAKGHLTDKRVHANIDWDYDEYYVRVFCSTGGDYDISGGNDAYYGEVKTIEFYPERGYVLTEVLVDGESVAVGANNTITLTVKRNPVVRAYFEKASNLASYTLKASASGNGSIAATKNGNTVDADKISAKYYDSVTYKFVPASKNYVVSSVKVDGRSVGTPNSYTFSKLDENHSLEVKFSWKNPFADVKSSYEKAVEYVTEAGIMSGTAKANGKVYFSGNVKVSVKSFAAALAEMADTADKLDTVSERLAWAEKYELIDDDTDLSVTCDVQTACAMVRAFLEALEDINDISFVDLDYRDTVKETAIAIDMVTATTYKNNRNLNRYDLASVCYLVAGLAYEK